MGRTGVSLMTIRKVTLYLIVAACLLALVPSLQALTLDGKNVNVIYQNAFSSDPRWTTNNPSSDYWDPSLEMYHFSIEPSTGAYAYAEINNYDSGSFILDYDLLLTRIDDGATFRMGFSGPEMDFNKGPNVLSQFTNGKFGQIMWLHLITPGEKKMEVNSQSGDTLTSGASAYNGPTVKYELNKMYHVTLDYNGDQKLLSMKVNEKTTGNQIWSYYLNTIEDLRGMNRVYLGSKGDYGMMNIYAQGYIDNVRLTSPAAVSTTPTGVSPVTTIPATTPTKKPTLKQTGIVPTPSPTTTPQSPSSGILAITALGIIVVCGVLTGIKKN
jgi:hypothetical protein